LNDGHSNFTLEILMNQDNKSQPQQGDHGNKPDQQGQQPGQKPGQQQTQQPSEKPGQGAAKN
jgi:hypothetical protein